MSGHQSLILLIVVIAMTVGGAFVLYSLEQRVSQTPHAQVAGALADAKQGDLQFVNIVGDNIAGENVSQLRIQVRYEGDSEISLNDTYIQIKTEQSIADLRYRNGTLERDISDGFYTN